MWLVVLYIALLIIVFTVVHFVVKKNEEEKAMLKVELAKKTKNPPIKKSPRKPKAKK
jgi:hypothetical protein